jgi:hypothetical protein
MRELYRVHLPGYAEEMTLEGQWQPNLRAFTAHREVWNLLRKVMNRSKIRWVIRTFKPLKSVGTDGMAPALLQQGVDPFQQESIHPKLGGKTTGTNIFFLKP